MPDGCDAENLGSLCFIVHEKIATHRSDLTDGHGENSKQSSCSPRKKAAN